MTDYYIDSNYGDDANSGLSSSLPKKTFTQVNALTGDLTGDTINIAKDSIFREALTLADAYGTVSDNLIIQAYGSGNKPIILGSDLVSGATMHTGDIYKLSSAADQDFHYNGARVPKIAFDTDLATTLALMTSNSSFYDSSDTKLYVWLSDDSDPNGVAEVTSRDQCIYVTSSLGFVTISGFQCDKARLHNIALSAVGATATPSGFMVVNNSVNYAGVDNSSATASDGILTYGTDNTHRVSASIYANNDGVGNLNNLIELAFCDSSLIKQNVADNCGGNLIEFWESCSSNKCEQNIATNIVAQGNGLSSFHESFAWVSNRGTSTGNIFKSNILDKATLRGLHIETGTHEAYNNVLIGVKNRTIDITGTASLTLKNNILGAGLGDGTYFPRLIATVSGTTLVSDYNIFYNQTATNPVKFIFDGVNRGDLAAFQAASSQEGNSLQEDPLFSDLANADYTLQSTSSGIAGGVAVSGVVKDYIGEAYHATPDIGAYQNGIVRTETSVNLL